MMKGAGDVFTSIEYNVYAVDPGMSYVSKETEGADPPFWRATATSAKASQ
jgi:hypothetical protein